jgi:hypothetical protein
VLELQQCWLLGIQATLNSSVEPQWWYIEKDQYLKLLGPFCSFLLLFAMFHAKMSKSKAQLAGSSLHCLQLFYSWNSTTTTSSWQAHAMATITTLRFTQPRKIDLHIFQEGV